MATLLTSTCLNTDNDSLDAITPVTFDNFVSRTWQTCWAFCTRNQQLFSGGSTYGLAGQDIAPMLQHFMQIFLEDGEP